MNALRNKLLALVVLATIAIPDMAQAAGITSQTKIGSLDEVPAKIFNVLIWFLPAIATIYMIISGYRYIVSQGNPDLMEKAKKSLTYAVVGVVVSYSAVLIIRLVGGKIGFGLLI